MSVLPGQIRKLRDTVLLNLTCDHCDPETDEYCPRKASHEVIGECDSHGHEAKHYCEEHIEVIRKEMAEEDRSGTCDWCQRHVNRLSPCRDFEEGTLGPVYDVCKACIREQNERISEELEEDDDIEPRSYDNLWANPY